MKIGVIADDFTGASDIALMLAEGGMTVLQYSGVPDAAAAQVEAGVIALKSRTAPVGEAVALSLAACDWLLAQGCTQIVFKICSTFDSAGEGNIGPVAEALAIRLGEGRVLVCPAYPRYGRTVFQGHLFVDDRLLNESGMQMHPLTPMRDPDLRRVLARQTSWRVDHIDAATVFQGAGAIAQALANGSRAMVITDVTRDADLVEIAAAARDRRLLCGGSGLALGLPGNFGFTPHPVGWKGVPGPGVVLSGSCSAATRGQIERYRARAPALELSAEDVMTGGHSASSLVAWVRAQSSDAPPMIFSSATPGMVRAAQKRFGRAAVASGIEALFGAVAEELAAGGVTRFVVAGGETSGAVVAGLGANCLRIGPRIADGVPSMRVVGRGLALALKSGNFGGEDVFETALAALAGKA